MAKIPFYAFALVLAAVLLVAPGCALKDQEDHAIAINDRFTSKPLVVPKYLPDRKDLLCLEINDSKPCYCFTCKNNTGLKIPLLASSYDHTLVGGACNATYCSQDDYEYFVNKSEDIEMRTFMLGSGQSFVSGGAAGLYCNYTLQLATKWMKGSEGKPPAVPLADRAYCWLGRGMLPLFIYYTGGKEISAAKTSEIAQALNAADAGPAMMTTEAGLNGSDDIQVGEVKAQIEAMQACKKCIKVLAVTSNGHTALYSILGVPGNIDYAELAKVDAIGFGFRTNDYPHCDMDQIIYENINFSSYILQKYNKPTIWLYVGASEGNSSIGNESTGGCTWDAAKVSTFYKELMAHASEMANDGVLGMSLYEFVDRSGPIPCNGVQGCDFGMLNVSGGQKHPELNAWSDMCQEINVKSEERTPLFFSRNGQGGTKCGLNTQNEQALMHSGMDIGTGLGLMTGDVAATPKIRNMGCGEACVSNVTMINAGIYDNTGNGFADKTHCSLYPLIDEFADNLDISATYMRATVEIESKFNPWAVSNVSDTNMGCNEKNYTMQEICELAGVAPADCPAFNHPQGQKPCAFGLAMCIDYPGKAYTKENPFLTQGESPPVMRDYIKGCGAEKYNPFDPGMNACCGANVYGEALARARAYVSAYWASIGNSVCSGGLSEDERHYAEYIIASNSYNGQTMPTIGAFLAQRDNPSACSGEQNYINYILRTAPTANLYGAKVMSTYASAVVACTSDCPGK